MSDAIQFQRYWHALTDRSDVYVPESLQDKVCQHDDLWFDRSLCHNCGDMHYYCVECSELVGECEPPDHCD